jgi:vanillate/3-O-methylgallate O-demethylase
VEHQLGGDAVGAQRGGPLLGLAGRAPVVGLVPRDHPGFMWADRVSRDGATVGVATSRGYSYWFRQMISLSTLDVAVGELGTELTVHRGKPGGRQEEIRAGVAPAPYEQDNSRRDLAAG